MKQRATWMVYVGLAVVAGIVADTLIWLAAGCRRVFGSPLQDED